MWLKMHKDTTIMHPVLSFMYLLTSQQVETAGCGSQIRMVTAITILRNEI